MKSVLVTGVTGQDGAYLAEFLLHKNYVVYGTCRNRSKNLWRLEELNLINHPRLYLIEHDLTDAELTKQLVEKINPSEIYHLAAPSFVGLSIEQPYATMQAVGMSTLNLLEAIRLVNSSIRFYQASTAEMFGKTSLSPQTEKTPFYPANPYSVAKLHAHWLTVNYAETYGIFACSGILFNHESPLRGREFVTRKITEAVANIKLGSNKPLELGNLDAKRDWGYAKEYVEAMYLMLQSDRPDTYVLATNRCETVRHFVELAFKAVEIKIDWRDESGKEVGIHRDSGEIVVQTNPEFYRPTEIYPLVGNAEKAKSELGWEAKTSLEALCRLMVFADIARSSKHFACQLI